MATILAAQEFTMIQALESRRLLSVAYGDDQIIRIKLSGLVKNVVTTTNIDSNRFRLSVDGEERIFRWKAVKQLKIDTSDGADLIDFRNLKVRCYIDGGKGGDTIYGGRRADYIFGDGGSDIIYGNEDHDTLEGGLRDDSMYGGVGNDTLIPFSDPLGDDSVFGEDGIDTVDYSGETKDLTLQIKTDGNEPEDVVTDDIFGDVEIIKGGTGNDNIASFLTTGITILGGAGNDTLTGGDGDDLIDGGTGNDRLYGGNGDDRFILGLIDGLADGVNGGGGNNSIIDSETDSADLISNIP